MFPRKLQELWDDMERSRSATLGMAGGLTEHDFARRVGGEWSVAEIIEHLIIAESGTSKVIRKCLKENAGKLPPYPADDSVLAVRPLRTSPEKVTEAPAAAVPAGGTGKEALLALADGCRKQTRISFEMLAGADPRSVEFPHPLFGSLNLYEWPCLIVLGHEKQHHVQIAEIVRKLRG